MIRNFTLPFLVTILSLSSCGTLDEKMLQINAGATKDQVVAVMGAPQDRQFQGVNEAWQYCVSGAGFGFNDHKVIWFQSGLVAGITTYRTTVPGCSSGIQSVDWEEAPDFVVETRER